MYISELSIYGFKSFANKEKLSFGNGITAVVGPNGCGKTNIVDAVRWVLGEQKIKTLRSSNLDDIIFNGSESLKPLSVCEVSLKVQNNRGILPIEYDEIEISRRIFRDGESEYMINRNICRLKDIISLFVDTGMGSDAYSVIELKMIEDILSDNTDNRRKMFEEASGINKYRQDRKLTLLRLKSTKTDLERVNDIISEVSSKVNGLQLQMKRFKRHSLLVENLKLSELSLAFLERNKLLNQIKPLKENISKIKINKNSNLINQNTNENDLKKLRYDYDLQQKNIKNIQKEIDGFSQTKQNYSNQVIILNEKINSSNNSIIKLQDEFSKGNDKIVLNDKKIKDNINQIKFLDPELKKNKSDYDLKQKDLGQSENKLIASRKFQEEKLAKQINLIKKTNDLKSNKLRTSSLINEKEDLIKLLESENNYNQNQFDLLNKELFNESEKLNDLIRESKREFNLVDNKKIKKNNFEDELNTLNNELNKNINVIHSLDSQKSFFDEMIISGEGYSSGNKYILKNKKNFPDIYGTISDIIKIDKKYKIAIGALLGSLGQTMVCKNKKTCLETIKELMDKKVGQLWLISKDIVNSKELNEKNKLKSNNILNKIKTEQRYLNLIKLVFKDKYIVKNYNEALELLSQKNFNGEVADLDGNLYSSNGLIISKPANDDSTLIGRDEKLKKIKEKIENSNIQLSSFQDKIKKIKKKINIVNDEINMHDEKIKNLNIEINKYDIKKSNISISLVEYKVKNEQNKKLFLSTNKEIKILRKNFENIKPESEKLEYDLNLLEKEINNNNIKLDIDRNNRDSKNLIVQDSRIKLVSLESKLENIQFRLTSSEEIITDIKKRNLDIESELFKLKELIIKMNKDKKGFEENSLLLSTKLQKLIKDKLMWDENFNFIYKQIEVLENKIRTDQKNNEEIFNKIKNNEMIIIEKELKIKNIQNSIKDKYNINIPDKLNHSLNENELYLQLRKIKTSIENIGPINMNVSDEYNEESKRLLFLNKQKNDLNNSEKSLIDTMENIDQEARKKFLTTFENIKNNYKKTFQMFFDGGESDIKLIGDNDPLDSEIEIYAKPPGKNTRNLRMLSSGEKSLTAISLLFAIYLVKPSPFCILDEVDAPLDDNNILKFTKVLKKFSVKTQFIIITHNKLTMESAQSLYGVTMQKSGVSKIVSVKLD